MRLHRSRLTYPLLVALVVGCERPDPLEPTAVRAAKGSGSTPDAPSGASAVAVSESQIDVSWQDNSSNELGFEVHRSSSPSGVFSLRLGTGPNVTSFRDEGLSASSQYCYKVRALRKTGNNTGYSAFSNTACATTLTPPPPPAPAAPSDLFVTPEGSTVIYLSAQDNSTNEDGFRVERSTDTGANWSIAATHSAIGGSDYWLAIIDTGQTSEREVCYRVFAFNAGGDSPSSGIGCNTPPAAPTNLVATMLDSVTVHLAWTDNSAVEDGHEVREVYVDEWGGIGYTSIELPPDSTEYRTTCCASYYVVRATKHWFGFSDWSNQAVPSASPAGATRSAAHSTSGREAVRQERSQP